MGAEFTAEDGAFSQVETIFSSFIINLFFSFRKGDVFIKDLFGMFDDINLSIKREGEGKTPLSSRRGY